MRKRWVMAALASVLGAACGGFPTSPSTFSFSAGEWSGTTAQGRPISFEVSSTEILTKLSVSFSFNGCAGVKTFTNLNVSTVSTVGCLDGSCPSSPLRKFDFSDEGSASSGVTRVNAQFRPGGQAFGIVDFRDYPGCGSALGVSWTATRK